MEFSSYDWKKNLLGSADFEVASSSELSAILHDLDADSYLSAVPVGGGLFDSAPLGFRNSFCVSTGDQMPDIDPVLMYINDLLMAEDAELQRSNSQQRAQDSPQDLLWELDGDFLSLPAYSCENLFSNSSSVEKPAEDLVPRMSSETKNVEKDEVESWINELIEVASQSEEQFYCKGPTVSAALSITTPGNGFPELSFDDDLSLQNFEDILDKAVTNSVYTFTDDFPELDVDGSFDTRTEEASRNLPESESAVGEERSGWARPSTGTAEIGRVAEQVSGPIHDKAVTTTPGRQKQPSRLMEAATGGGYAREESAGVVKEGATVLLVTKGGREEEGGKGGAGTAQKKGGGGGRGRRRRRGGPRLRLAEPSVVDLRALLVNCAQAVSSLDTTLARKILNDIAKNASPLGNGMQRLAHYFAEGLAVRLLGRPLNASSSASLSASASASTNIEEAQRVLKAYHTFVAVCPFLKLSHFAANDAILNVARGAHRLHILDFNILYGFQWPCFIQALAERAGGPPVLRITAVDIPSHASTPLDSPATTASRLAETGRRLAGYASLYGVPFEYQIWERHWQDISAASLHLQPDEVLAVNCIHRLRHLMDETMVAPPANPRKALLTLLRRLNPHLFVEGIVNATYNVPFFLSRFREALFHYSSFFDALDSTIRSDLEERLVIEREIMGREILNVVACEGMDRLERPETYRQWQLRTQSVGFEMLRLDPLLKSKAQALVHNFYHKDYGVEDDDQGHWLLLGWKGRILHGISIWRPSSSLPSF